MGKREEQAMTLCVRWIHEDDPELKGRLPQYCDHGYCHGRGQTMGDDGVVLEITIERLPSGNFNMLNERGNLICRVVDGSELAKFIQKQFEKSLFTLRIQLEKP